MSQTHPLQYSRDSNVLSSEDTYVSSSPDNVRTT